MTKPLMIDLYCGLGGWTEGGLTEGYHVIGFDIERHEYGDDKYPGQLVLQDVRTLHGSQFKNAALIVGSSPCQEFSYRAMPWKRAKALPPPYLGMELFEAQFRIQREASEAAGHHIPMVVENVRGAQKWVGRAMWNYGSYYLWGDMPGLMPYTKTRGYGDAVKRPGRTMCYPEGSANPDAVKGRTGKLHWQDESGAGLKNPGFRFDGSGRSFQSESVNRHAVPDDGFKTRGMNWSDRSLRGQDFTRVAGAQAHAAEDHLKLKDQDGYDRDHPQAFGWKKPRTSSGSNARKAASAKIAKIPFDLARHIARVYRP